MTDMKKSVNQRRLKEKLAMLTVMVGNIHSSICEAMTYAEPDQLASLMDHVVNVSTELAILRDGLKEIKEPYYE